MSARERAAMILVNGLDDETHAAKLPDIVAPARTGMIDRRTAPLASRNQVPERPGIATDDFMDAAIRLDLGDKAKFIAHANLPPMPASSQTSRAVEMERRKRREMIGDRSTPDVSMISSVSR